jgi:hypothetical protein
MFRRFLAEPTDITVKSVAGDPYDRIVDYKLGAKPPVPSAVMAQPEPSGEYQGEPDELPAIPNDDIPF